MRWAQPLTGAILCVAIACVPLTALAQSDTPAGITKKGNDDSFTLNLKDADINTLIATVSEVTGRNFVVDPRVKGKVTVLSNQAMTPNELYQTFLSVLDVHGFATVPSGDVTKIIPETKAKQNGGAPANQANEDMATKVIHVDNVAADKLVPVLRPLVPQYGHLAAYSASNSLVISDREANIKRLSRIVHRIDSNGTSNIESIHLDNADASDVADAVDKLQGKGKHKGTSVVPDDRTNSLIISGSKAERARLRSVITKMDTKAEDTGNTQVIYLNYADAETLAPVLQAYAEGKSYASGSQRSNQLSGLGNNNSGFGNNSRGSGFGNSGSSFGNSRSGLSRQRSSSRGSQGMSGSSGSGSSSDEGSDVSVIAEAGANALIIHAPKDKMKQMKKVLSKLDIRRGQVLVEAIIAEISLSRSRQLGVNIGALNKDGPAAASILDSDTFKKVPSLANNGTPLNLIQQGLNVAVGNVSSGGTSFALLVNALSGNSDTNVLSTPSLITRDNEEAQIKVGKEVPFKTGSYTNSNGNVGNNGGVNPFTTIDREDVGLQLGFIPQISASDTIQLTIDQEISSIAPSSQQESSVDLITKNRALRTSVEVKNGQILVLGGLIDNSVNVTHQAVPVLGKIPILGALFRYNSVSKEKRNLLNFIRPTVLRGDGEADHYTRKKYNYIRSMQQRQRHKKIPLMGDEKRPQLPDIHDFDGGTKSSASRQKAEKNDHGSHSGKRRGDQFSD